VIRAATPCQGWRPLSGVAARSRESWCWQPIVGKPQAGLGRGPVGCFLFDESMFVQYFLCSSQLPWLRFVDEVLDGAQEFAVRAR